MMYQLPKDILDQIPLGQVTTVYGETYYRTKHRVFVFRVTEDESGYIPTWACVQWINQVNKTSKGRGSEGWHEDFELESRRHEAGQDTQTAIYEETEKSQGQNPLAP